MLSEISLVNDSLLGNYLRGGHVEQDIAMIGKASLNSTTDTNHDFAIKRLILCFYFLLESLHRSSFGTVSKMEQHPLASERPSPKVGFYMKGSHIGFFYGHRHSLG